MKDLRVDIYTNSGDIPDMECRNLFHSKRLFTLYELTPRQKPYMVVATAEDGRVVAHLLAVVRYRWSLFPPYIYMHCYVSGEGEYTGSDVPQAHLFGAMLSALTAKMSRRVLYIEFANLSSKMFGYREFKKSGFFPVHWMSIHNSLHSKPPEERLSKRMLKRIRRGEERGVVTEEVATDDDFAAFFSLLRRHNRLKPRRYIPNDDFFRGLMETQGGRLFLTKYKGRAVGCCACVYSGGNAYLWYMASLRKTYIKLHPDTLTLWAAIRHAYDHGYAHIYFLDVGLPFSRNPFREFILSFGGKPVSTYRWFRITIWWLNRLFSFIYRD